MRRFAEAAQWRANKARLVPKETTGSTAGDAEPADLQIESSGRRAPKLSDSLLRRLAAHRTLALQALLASNVRLTLAGLTVNALPTAGATADVDALTSAAALDMADWSEPTAATFMNYALKVQIVKAFKARVVGSIPASRTKFFALPQRPGRSNVRAVVLSAAPLRGS